MATIKISRGAGSADIDAGVYEVTLAAVEGPKTIYPANAPEGTNVLDWRFVLDDGSEVSGTTSESSGPRSKMYSWLTALNSGKPPEIDDEIDLDTLVGRRAIATIEISSTGWPRIANLGAIPVQAQQKRFAQTTGAPVQTTEPQDLPQQEIVPPRRPTPPVTRPAPARSSQLPARPQPPAKPGLPF
jgi:hypothetical protein